MNYMSNGKVMVNHLIAGWIKKITSHKMSYFPEPDSYGRNKTERELDLSNYATKSEIKKKRNTDIVKKKTFLKRIYDELGKKVNTIDSDKQNLEKKIYKNN